ncbi:MAG: aldehyde dehydrogenase family protein, partial [Pseudoalteromonas sp.]|nr:aldehyde dehydrogenase family protein [Pseudoalteromonas sp.]
MTTPIYQNFINGQFLANKSGETFDVVNPATGQVIYAVEVADQHVQNAAIESAKQGFKVWSAMTPIERSRILLNAVAILRERNDDLALVEVLDTGKPTQEANCVAVETGPDVNEYFQG